MVDATDVHASNHPSASAVLLVQRRAVLRFAILSVALPQIRIIAFLRCDIQLPIIS
jgi:hypothetical protein